MTFHTPPHTPADLEALTRCGYDPDTVQPRERAVPCVTCRRPTWNIGGGCDAHYVSRSAR
jgi:hypothetical protein